MKNAASTYAESLSYYTGRRIKVKFMFETRLFLSRPNGGLLLYDLAWFTEMMAKRKQTQPTIASRI
jgi:hypothetical protein